MAAELKEYIVTLNKGESLDAFYEDMETPGGDLYIPDREVEVSARRSISRNTHYMLSDEEVITLKNDSRVMDVVSADILKSRRPFYSLISKNYSKGVSVSNVALNWALKACSTDVHEPANWGLSQTATASSVIERFSTSGKNVDVVIMDGHINPNHPSYAINSDGTGGSRVNQYNWFQHNAEVGVSGSATYVYGDYSGLNNNHGAHVAGIAAGNQNGWARDANIYNMSPYGDNPNGLNGYAYVFDFVRAFHNNKAENSETGLKNPTIVNMSFGYWQSFASIQSTIFRGTTFDPGRDLTEAEMEDRGITVTNGDIEIPYLFAADAADIQDMIDDGIICVGAAGNNSMKVVDSGHDDYNNQFTGTLTGDPVSYSGYTNRGDAVSSTTICVGAVDNDVYEGKAYFSNCGNQVDIFAPGMGINSSVNNNAGLTGYTMADARAGDYYLDNAQGTSMAAPQVTGVLACILQEYPWMTHADALEWLTTNGVDNRMGDTGLDTGSDAFGLRGAPNRYLRYRNERSYDGAAFPRNTRWLRPSSGVGYPRTRIRRT